MKLQLNGEAREFTDTLVLAELVDQLGMKPDRVAVELNLEIVPRADWPATRLKDGDKLEIVHFVGGGGSAALETDARNPDEPEDVADMKWTCPTCRAESTAGFCGACGEKKPGLHDLSVRHLLGHAGEALFHWDSKIFRTLRVLLTRPGQLSDEYAKGRRKPYVHPFQVFFIANVLYFLLYPVIGWSGLKTPLFGYQHWMSYSGWATRLSTHHAAVKGLSMVEFSQRFDHVIDIQARSMVLVMVPLFAVALLVLEQRPKRYFGEHLVFALHYLAVFLLVIMIGLCGAVTLVLRLLRPFGVVLHGMESDWYLSVCAALILGPYLFFALRRFYKDSISMAFVKSVLLLFATYEMLNAYRIILFLAALYSA
ncbi:MAG TPA: sulfur carrier protein ThiS [Verrucomicrobiae bacterium]|jgi:thiamine biosynthesis protein ThiS|nr:sulfur carrier protein ThiS [Verrucomicrobiae bacterium]